MLSLAERSILRRKLERYEGRVPHMYLDSSGHVTVGVGHLLSSLAAAQRLAFVTDVGVRATIDQIAADYKEVRTLKADEHHSFYRPHMKLRLPDVVIEQLTQRHIDSFHRELRVIYPDFDRFSGPIRLALFDMVFNLGATGLRRDWPKMNKAIRDKDWRMAARESYRYDVGEERNRYVRDLFQSAAAVEVVP